MTKELTKRHFKFLCRRGLGWFVEIKKTLNTTMDDHAKDYYISSFGYILFFAVFHFKTSLHLLKDIELVLFVYKKPEID